MCFGNMLGFTFDKGISRQELFAKEYGAIVLEVTDTASLTGLDYKLVGKVTNNGVIEACGEMVTLCDALAAWEGTLEKVYPTRAKSAKPCQTYTFARKNIITARQSFAKPRVFIPVFPGTNCEYDTARVFEAAGAVVDVLPFINLTPNDTDANA